MVGAYEEQSACRQWAEDLQPAVRFCQYQLDRKGASSGTSTDLFPDQGLTNDTVQVQHTQISVAVIIISHYHLPALKSEGHGCELS